MRAMFWVWTVVTMALIAWIFHEVGPWVATAAGLWGAFTLGYGVQAGYWDIKSDGYVLEKRVGRDDKKRWHVGVRRPQPKVNEQIEWIDPGEPEP